MSRSALRERVAERVRDPLTWTALIQLAKTVVAAVAAWVIADQVLGLPQAFLAPWSALLVVHSTVYRTFSRGLQQVTGTVLGVLSPIRLPMAQASSTPSTVPVTCWSPREKVR